MEFKCVIFDCDGVLVDSELIENQVLISMARQFGLEMTLEKAIENFKGKSLSDCLQIIEKLIQRKLPDYFVKEYRYQSFDAFKKELKPIEGVKEFIANLDVPYCVASSGPIEKITLNLTTTGLIENFKNSMFSSYQINSWKPEPKIFLHAASEMGYGVDDCIVIEDSLPGVMAAVTGGFRVYALVDEKNELELQHAGAIVFRGFEELAKILKPDRFQTY